MTHLGAPGPSTDLTALEQLLHRSRALAATLASGAQRETTSCDGRGLVRIVLDGSGLVSDVEVASRRRPGVTAADVADAVVEAVTAAQLARLQHVTAVPPPAAPVPAAPGPAAPAPVPTTLVEVLAVLADVGQHVDAALAGAPTDPGGTRPMHQVHPSPARTVTVTTDHLGTVLSVHIDDRWFATAPDASVRREIALGCRAAQTASVTRSTAAVAAPLAALQRDADRLLQLRLER